jgi:hypothetical protein
MPNWKQITSKNLRVLRACSPEFAEEITEELAGHLEDSYERYLQGGLSAEAALQRSLGEIEHARGNWLALRLLKEDRMTGFARKIGLPGLLTFASAMVIAWALDMAHIQPKTLFLANGLFLSIPTVWLCLLPLCGAVGTLVSHRSGGSRLQRIAASLFPSAIMSTVLLLGVVVGFAISRFAPGYGWDWAFVVPGLALWLMTYTVLTAVSLLLGVAVAEQAKRICARAA